MAGLSSCLFVVAVNNDELCNGNRIRLAHPQKNFGIACRNPPP
jgi:hypothetical protein